MNESRPDPRISGLNVSNGLVNCLAAISLLVYSCLCLNSHALAQAPVTMTVERTDVSGKHRFRVELKANPRADKRALDYLAKMLRIVPADRAKLGWKRPGASEPSDIAITLTSLGTAKAERYIVLPPDGFTLSARNRVRMSPTLYKGLIKTPQYRLPTKARARPLQRSTGATATLSGKLKCKALNGSSEIDNDLPFAKIRVLGARTQAGASGDFTLEGNFRAGDVYVEVTFQGKVENHGQSTLLKVMQELHDARGETVRARARLENGQLKLGEVTLTSVDCEIFRLGALVLTDYHEVVGASPPANRLRLKRWSGVWDGTPYAYYDYIVLTTDWGRKGGYVNEAVRRHTIFHEFGHSIRHVADGDEAHWGWDNFRWAYARVHSGCEVFNTQYAFNEGWAVYWRIANSGGGLAPACPGITDRFLDWNENSIGNHLAALAGDIPKASNAEQARKMVQVLIENPGAIHSIRDFEVAYCKLHHSGNSRCQGNGVPTRADPASCPTGFNDDGATCRLINILAKPSYGRGAGTIPTGCPSGRPDNDAGLCYPRCSNGYSGVGPVCWERCPSGFPDHGAFCGKPEPYGRGVGYAWQFGDPPFDLGNARQRCEADHGSCEQNGLIYYPRCRSGFHAAGCCICSPNCPSGMADIGVSCTKRSYGRGVGEVPTICLGGKENDAGLCYDRCRAGFNGVGPVCWGKCEEGFEDHGATCYRPPNILVKY